MLIFLLFYVLWGSFGCNHNPKTINIIYYNEAQISPYELALRFAPRLYINTTEPYQIKDLIIVKHSQKPLIAYNFIWEDDSIAPGFGYDSDHEIAWVEYDPVSLNLVDFWVLWHRGILHTDLSVSDAKNNGQHPCIFVQWGQHGLLPLGWEKISTARLDIELRVYYAISKSNPYYRSNNKDSLIRFDGSYSDYLTFDKVIDTGQYIKPDKVIVAIDSNKIIPKMLSYKIMTKQPWPY